MLAARTKRTLAIAAIVLLHGSVAQSQSLTVVDTTPGPGVDFTDLQSAIDASSEGGAILVLATAPPFVHAGEAVIDGKSLTLFGTPPGLAELSGIPALTVRNLAAHQTVVVQNLILRSGFAPATSALTIADCIGTVLLDRCEIEARGVLVERSHAVVLTDTRSTGRHLTPGDPIDVLAGLVARDATIHLYDSTIAGGGDGAGGCSHEGGTGMILEDASLTAVGSSIRGGDGCSGQTGFGCGAGQDGGTGVVLVGEQAFLFLRDSNLRGGFAGGSCLGNDPGSDGSSVVGDTNQVIDQGGASRTLALFSPVAEGSLFGETYAGPVGELAVLSLSAGLAPPVPLLDGFFHLDSPLLLLRFRGVIPADGTLERTTPLGDLGPGVEVVGLAGQAIFLDPLTLEAFVSAPSRAQLLDTAP